MLYLITIVVFSIILIRAGLSDAEQSLCDLKPFLCDLNVYY